jgi:DNA-binding HxlR family transcriptional regulator
MLPRSYRGQECSIARTLEIVGDRWTLLIVRDAFLGLRRFDQFSESLGIASNVLSDRLDRLVDEGILDRVPYGEHPARYEYRLTEKGQGLRVALIALMQWGDDHVNVQPPRIARRKSDGVRVRAALVAEDGALLRPDEMETVPRSATLS